MAREIINGIATIDGQNIFKEINSLGQLVSVFAGFASMVWEDLSSAGEFQSEDASAGCNAFAERANAIIWEKLYQCLKVNLRELDMDDSDLNISHIVKDLDLWN